MSAQPNRQTYRTQDGFTLIELMVVVLIIGLLLAIAIPQFLGARNASNAAAAESNLRTALTAEQVYWHQNQEYDVTGTTVATDEPALHFTTSEPVNPGRIVLISSASDPNEVVLTSAGMDGYCYSLASINDQASGHVTGTFYVVTTRSSGAGSTTACTAPPAFTAATVPANSSARSTVGQWATAW